MTVKPTTVVIGSGMTGGIRPAGHFAHPTARRSSSVSDEREREQRRRSIVILSLLAACAFLFVLSLCLLTALVLVGRNLSSGAGSHSQLTAAVSDEPRLSVTGPVSSNKGFDRPDEVPGKDVGKVARNESDTGGPDEQAHNRSTIFLPNSVYYSGSSGTAVGRMNRVLKMGSKVAEKLGFRLPRHIRPVHYDLWLHPDLQRETFAGRVRIDLNVTEPTNYIVVHSKKLAITETVLRELAATGGQDGSEVGISRTYEVPEHEYWVIETQTDIAAGDYRLSLQFNGSLADRIIGFYSSKYLDKKTNTTRKIATSKFEPTFARQAFPCFDEPQLKAEYTIHLVHPNGDDYEALSNMNVKETVVNQPTTGLATTTFERSVSMSTYLVVFIVSDFVNEEVLIRPAHGDNFPLRVYATKYQKDNIAYALMTARKIIEHYVEYFGIPYPLPKLDMAAIPDFVSGAMETWGLVTYRETSILYNAATSSTANKQRVAGVIGHELAHMWFGNLVTMKWWNELWLNEGFASYIEYKGIHAAEPEWGIEEQFLIDDLHGVLNLDATLGSHPIVVPVESPNQITEIFDTITYSKGASVIRMLEDFVTPDVFRQGVQNYLTRLSFGNGVSEDLMKELDELVPDISVATVMDTFTKQKGLPVVSVRRNALQYILTQQRFLADQTATETEESPFNYRWYIPITYVTSADKETVRREWFPHDQNELIIEVPGGTANGWMKLNYRQIGYYRVNYPVEMWEEFGEALRNDVNTFTIGDRTGLVNDAFALADASMLAYSTALELTRYLSNEAEYVPWSAIASKLKTIRNLLYNFNSYDDITAYTQRLVTDVAKQVGWDVPTEGKHMENLLRTTILDLACSFGHSECLAEAGTRFRGWLNGNDMVHPDLRSIVYTYGIQSDGITVADWERVLERFQAENDANEKTKLMVALASYPDQRTMRRFLDLSWDPALIRTQDQLSCIQYIAANRHGEQAAWEHVRENWERLVDRFTIGERNLGRMIPSVTGRFTTRARLTELQDFFARYPEAGAGVAARRQALETIENNISWLERNEANVATWLKQESAPTRA
ncbi:aminopeptidase A-like [Anopheles ziemanni]|uniref:aminopeptidase A-like n=1 Tax=Anopheles coustani TaxID=139045 RepID=UPI00265B7227|nr:aminopeptidase A-like [Anopheles coustani]XP_058129125.1 aminopeptidase A-like [Anopheles coustani]XP_058129126.1 aminopeptidase A-like [Anopheles coustani]XP_058129127.1 aminopeptidase A-like [Anopheles coustani]XP_058174033.1 aminopeptidase A-like [Anopheles ziemanni]